MKKDAVFINIGRGSTVNEEDLIEVLKNLLHWIEKHTCEVEWSWSNWKISSLLAIFKGTFEVAERNDCRN